MEQSCSNEAIYKELKGKYDIISFPNICTSGFRYPTCNKFI
jgi:hypothetical protein